MDGDKLYKLKSGRFVKKGDFVQIKLTNKVIKFLYELDLINEVDPIEYMLSIFYGTNRS